MLTVTAVRTDREFLMWIHMLLEHEYGCEASRPHMRNLRCLIARMPADQVSEPFESKGLEDLKTKLAERGY